MSTARRSCTNSDPQVTKRLFTVLALMIGFIFIFGGYMLGRMARNEVKTDLLTYNLTSVADSLYKKAKKLSPKALHHYDSEKIKSKFVSIFDCTQACCACASLDKNNVADFIKTFINLQVAKLMKSVHNASLYLDTLT